MLGGEYQEYISKILNIKYQNIRRTDPVPHVKYLCYPDC